MIYLDANATEKPRPQARAAMLQALDQVGNPSSVHGAGRAARRSLEAARHAIATRFGASPADLVFTSGGTEANALAVTGLSAGRRIIVGATEHDAVYKAAQGAEMLPVSGSGQVDLAALHRLLQQGPAFVCLMLANNETGILHPIQQAAALCHENGALLHVDAVQAAGRMSFTRASLFADSLALSGHKVGGPMGAGALILAPNLHVSPSLAGGGQERGRRGGTPSLPAIAGFAAALEAATDAASLAPLRDRAEAAAIEAGAIVCGAGPRLANTTCLALPGRRADTQVIMLDLAGIAVSAGAACSSGKVGRSRVLEAMGLGDLAGCAIRVSLPWDCTDSHIDAFIAAYRTLAGTGRAAAPRKLAALSA